MNCVKIDEGRYEHPQQPRKEKLDKGKTVDLFLCLTKPLQVTGSVVVMDIWFVCC